jgi:putative photosynthetic complex assembly protein
MTDTTAQTSVRRTVQSREKIPTGLLLAMAALALSSLIVASYAVLTGQPKTGVPEPAAIVTERPIVLEGHGAKSVTVREPDGTVILDLSHGGFVAVVENALSRTRQVRGVGPDLPVRLVRYANGRLSLIDPASGWSVELGAFGDDNRAAFERLLPQ